MPGTASKQTKRADIHPKDSRSPINWNYRTSRSNKRSTPISRPHHHSFKKQPFSTVPTITHPALIRNDTKLMYQVTRIGGDLKRPMPLFSAEFTPHTTAPSQNVQNFPDGKRSGSRIILQHALLASKSYWQPFIRSLHVQFSQPTSPIRHPVDLYIPDLRYHGDTAGLNSPDSESYASHYLDELSSDLHLFLTQAVLSPEEISAISDRTNTPSLPSPRVAIMGHSLGARTAMLWNLYIHAQLNQQQQQELPLQHWLAALPIISLDASPSTYHHDHQLLFSAMLNAQGNGDLISKQHLKASMSQLDDNTIAFALQNNLSTITVNDLTQKGVDSYGFNQSYIDQKLSVAVGHSHEHFWTSNIEKLSRIEEQVHKWPLPTPSELAQPHHSTQLNPHAVSKLKILAIGGSESTRLTTPSNLHDLNHFFPHGHREMIRGGHFAHQGIDSNKAAGYIANYLGQSWNGQSQ